MCYVAETGAYIEATTGLLRRGYTPDAGASSGDEGQL